MGQAWLHIALGNWERDTWLSCLGLGDAKDIRYPPTHFLPQAQAPCSCEAFLASSLPQDALSIV